VHTDSSSTAAAWLTCALSEAERLCSTMQVQWLAKRVSAVGFVLAGRKAVHVPHPCHVQWRDQGRAHAVWRNRVHGHPYLLITIDGPQGVRPLVETLCMVTVNVKLKQRCFSRLSQSKPAVTISYVTISYIIVIRAVKLYQTVSTSNLHTLGVCWQQLR
jgi:hypothetical protein